MKFGFTKILAGLAILVSVSSMNARADGGIIIGNNPDLASMALQTKLKMVVEYQYGIRAFKTIDEELLLMTDGGEGYIIRYKFYNGAYVVQFDVTGMSTPKVVNGVLVNAWTYTVIRSDEEGGVISAGSPHEFTLEPGQSNTIYLKKWVNYMQQNFRITFSI